MLVLAKAVAWRAILVLMLIHSTVKARETVKEAAILARKLVDHSSTSIGTMATVYPVDHPTLPGHPFSIQEYYASCHNNGSLTLIFLPISRHSQNILNSPSHSASISVSAEHPAAKNARVSLMGDVTIFRDSRLVPDEDAIRACYLKKHPDASWWLPDDDKGAHISYWARFDPHDVYFIGGFGGEHYIGQIPLHLYQGSTHALLESERGVTGRILVEQL